MTWKNTLNRTLSTSALLFLTLGFAWADKGPTAPERVDPPHWWVGMANDTLRLLVKSPALQGKCQAVPQFKNKDVQMLSSTVLKNGGYLKIVLWLDPNAQPVNLPFAVQTPSGTLNFTYALKPRDASKRQLMGLDASDQMYLITPDRFANGDPKNDRVDGQLEMSLNRKEPYDRHGGDLVGIEKHLDYVQSLGVTAVWINPWLANNQVRASYHGYAITDHYLVDPRFGTHADLLRLSNALHERGMKHVMDVVYNHSGDRHYLHQAQPDSTWFNPKKKYPRSNYRETTLFDPYASQRDKDFFERGWFDDSMPDWNLENKDAANYLIQNTLWWIEEAGIDALRIDTYTYPNQNFMARLNKVVRTHYPRMVLFGETWVHNHQSQAYFAGGFPLRPSDNRLNSVTDFQTYFALKETVTKASGWNEGVGKLYQSLAGDYLYQDPYRLVTFADNHDEGRYFGLCGEDLRKYKLGLTLLYTLRGIPCLYYGTELLMKSTENHGTMREDVPGGWPGDPRNAFTAAGRTPQEQEAFDFVQKLGNYRKSQAALHNGKMMQFAPENGLYAVARYTQDRLILTVVNASDQPATVSMERFDELLNKKRDAVRALDRAQVRLTERWEAGAWSSEIFEFQR
jgi:glycosidase